MTVVAQIVDAVYRPPSVNSFAFLQKDSVLKRTESRTTRTLPLSLFYSRSVKTFLSSINFVSRLGFRRRSRGWGEHAIANYQQNNPQVWFFAKNVNELCGEFPSQSKKRTEYQWSRGTEVNHILPRASCQRLLAASWRYSKSTGVPRIHTEVTPYRWRPSTENCTAVPVSFCRWSLPSFFEGTGWVYLMKLKFWERLPHLTNHQWKLE